MIHSQPNGGENTRASQSGIPDARQMRLRRGRRGYGFVSFEDVECASAAVAAMNGRGIGGRNIEVLAGPGSLENRCSLPLCAPSLP